MPHFSFQQAEENTDIGGTIEDEDEGSDDPNLQVRDHVCLSTGHTFPVNMVEYVSSKQCAHERLGGCLTWMRVRNT